MRHKNLLLIKDCLLFMQRFKLLPNFDFFQKKGGGLVLRTVQNTGNGREGGVTNVEYRKL